MILALLSQPSRTFFTTILGECSAIVRALLLLQLKTERVRFTVVIDHLSLRRLLLFVSATRRLARCRLCFQEVFYELTYRSVCKHPVADNVSRFSTKSSDGLEIDIDNSTYYVDEKNGTRTFMRKEGSKEIFGEYKLSEEEGTKEKLCRIDANENE